MTKLIIFGLLIFTVYFVGWNRGYDVGFLTKQSDDIINGIVVCKYK